MCVCVCVCVCMVRVWYTVLVHTFCFIGNKENCIRSTRTFGAGMTSILVRTRSGLNALNCLNTLNWLNQQPNHLIGLTLRSLRVPSRLLAISTCCHGHCFLIKVLSVSLPPRLPLPLSPSLSLSPRLPLSPPLSLSLSAPPSSFNPSGMESSTRIQPALVSSTLVHPRGYNTFL